jgi:predicted permease
MHVRDGFQAVRTAVRGLVRHPGYTIPALLTLALGIGANTATFSVLYAVVLRPLPYPAPDRLVELSPADVERGTGSFSLPDVRDWQERARSLTALGAYTTLPSDLILTVAGEDALEVETAYVTSGFFEAMATPPLLGSWLPPETEEGDNRVVVASHAFWVRQLGADAAAVGRTLTLSGEAYRLVGVLPEDFAYPDPGVELWAFLSVIPSSSIPFQLRGVRLLQGVARMTPATTVAEARDDVVGIAASLARTYPDSNDGVPTATVRPLRSSVVGDVRRPLAVLMASALLILAIVCANLANLALTREAGRETELAVRAALGASRARRAALVVAESLLLSLVGGALGLALAAWGTGALVSLNAGTLPRAREISPDWRIALFSLVVSMIVGLIFAFLPGMRAARSDLSDRLRAGARGLSGADRARNVLVVSQVALSVVLLVGAGLMGRSLQALGQVDPGFDPDGLVVADVTFPSSRYPDRPSYLSVYEETLGALSSLPGVRAAGTIRRFPFLGEGEGVRVGVPGQGAEEEGVRASLLQVSPGLFAAMGVTLLEGRDLPPGAGADGRQVAVLNRALARALFAGEPATGRTIRLGDQTLEVVGVVEDVHQVRLQGDAPATVYLPQRGFPRRGAAFVLRTDGPTAPVARAVRDALRRIDPGQPITELAPAADIVARQAMRPRFFALLFGAFASLALVLSAIGVYGVVAFGVARRRREVGIRLAMGADAREVQALVVRQGMLPVGIGIAMGTLAALALVRALASLLFGVGLYDPAAYLLGIAILATTGLVACWIPARSASRTEPVRALTTE